MSHTFVGPLVSELNRGFGGAEAITAEDGICDSDHAQSRLKELTARRRRDVYVLADFSNFCLQAFHECACLALPLVTDNDADPTWVHKFPDRAQVEVAAVFARRIGTVICQGSRLQFQP